MNFVVGLRYQFFVPDILYYDELEDAHPDLLNPGLKTLELSAVTLNKSMDLDQLYNKPSRNDCLALAAAMQENCMLLTGYLALRKAAIKEKVDVKGTIWIIQELISQHLIDKQQAVKAFDDMKEAGSRLPWIEVSKQLERI